MFSDHLFEGRRFDDAAILSRFLDRATTGQAASLIRLGDGEAKLLGSPDEIDRDRLHNQLRIWFGQRPFTDPEIEDIRHHLRTAIAQATFLGLPSERRTTARQPDGSHTRDALNCQALWGHLSATGLLARHDVLGQAEIHKSAQITRWFSRLFALDRPFVFVTRTMGAVDRLVEAFGISRFQVHLIPGETWSRATATSDHYPDVFRTVRARLAEIPQGTIGLVGGGVLGKIYCTDIAAAGGVAFDCGALFDTWARDVPLQRAKNMGDLDRMSVEFLKGGA